MTEPIRLEVVPAASVSALQEQLAALRHDLGKYVVLQLRWLPPEPDDDELREALRADLARTRSGRGQVESAVELWARLGAPLLGREALPDGSLVDLAADEDVKALEDALGRIRACLAGLDDAPRDELERGRQAALDAADATRRLMKRARAL
jgi:hypothetical protein